MAKKIFVTSENMPEVILDNTKKGAVKTYSIDFSQWAEENNAVTTVTWTVKSGQASVSGQALATNVATAQITTSQAGSSMLEVKGETGTETVIVNVKIAAKDPDTVTEDYGIIYG